MKLLGLFRALGSSSIFETKPRLFTLYLVVLADDKHNLWAFPFGAAAYAISKARPANRVSLRPGGKRVGGCEWTVKVAALMRKHLHRVYG